jgi:hypothetical protein
MQMQATTYWTPPALLLLLLKMLPLKLRLRLRRRSGPPTVPAPRSIASPGLWYLRQQLVELDGACWNTGLDG